MDGRIVLGGLYANLESWMVACGEESGGSVSLLSRTPKAGALRHLKVCGFLDSIRLLFSGDCGLICGWEPVREV